MFKKLAIAAALLYTGYCLNHIDYLVACAKNGWNNPEESLKHPWQQANNVYDIHYKKKSS